jgi:hypothetical protein
VRPAGRAAYSPPQRADAAAPGGHHENIRAVRFQWLDAQSQNHHGRPAAAGRAVAGLFGASWLTAGPGNYHALQVANAPARSPAIHVTLPTVVIVGRREQAEPIKVASSGALSAGNLGINPADPAAIRVNLRQ